MTRPPGARELGILATRRFAGHREACSGAPMSWSATERRFSSRRLGSLAARFALALLCRGENVHDGVANFLERGRSRHEPCRLLVRPQNVDGGRPSGQWPAGGASGGQVTARAQSQEGGPCLRPPRMCRGGIRHSLGVGARMDGWPPERRTCSGEWRGWTPLLRMPSAPPHRCGGVLGDVRQAVGAIERKKWERAVEGGVRRAAQARDARVARQA